MKLLPLGTGGYHPSETRHTACYFLPESALVLDAGTGFFRIPRYLRSDELTIFLSHAHFDHIIGLTYLLGFQETRGLKRVDVYGTPETLAAIEAHLFVEPVFPTRPRMELRPLAPEPCIIVSQGAKVTWFPLRHRGLSLGFRIDWPNKSLAYLTDTTIAGSREVLQAIRGVDLLLHECYFPDGYDAVAERTGHSCLSAVLELARDAAVKRLGLIHLNPLLDRDEKLGLEDKSDLFPNTFIACDLMEVEF